GGPRRARHRAHLTKSNPVAPCEPRCNGVSSERGGYRSGRRTLPRSTLDSVELGSGSEVGDSGVLRPIEGAADLSGGVLAGRAGGALNGLAGFEVLVHLEEVLYLQAVELRYVVDIASPGRPLVALGDAQDLVVPARFVTHPEHSQRAATDEATGEGGFFKEDECVERVAVLPQCSFDEPVFVRVPG